MKIDPEDLMYERGYRDGLYRQWNPPKSPSLRSVYAIGYETGRDDKFFYEQSWR